MIKVPGIVLCASVVLLPALGTRVAQVFTGRSDLVRLSVSALERGVPVVGLGASDFSVVDNGVTQEVVLFSGEDVPLFVVSVLDLSSSVAGDRLSSLKRAADHLLDSLTPTDSSALVTFGHGLAGATGGVPELRKKLFAAESSGNTSLIDALVSGLLLVSKTQGSRSLVLVFSDGMDTASFVSEKTALEVAGRTDATVYAVTLEKTRENRFLGQVTALTGGQHFVSSGHQDLRAVFARVLADFRKQYLLGYVPRGPQTTGWHSVDVKTARKGVDLKFRPRYLRRDP